MLDQVLVNGAMLGETPIRAHVESVRLLQMPGMVKSGAYPVPIAFGGMGRVVNTTGYSDHLPLGLSMTEQD